MKRYVEISQAMSILDDIAAYRPDKQKTTLIKLCKDVLMQLPAEEIEELVTCERCGYRSDNWHCLHSKGLLGKLQPTYYCMYGYPGRPDDLGTDTFTEEDEFKEFDDYDEADN